jgi:AraC-like DNA-binding protein
MPETTLAASLAIDMLQYLDRLGISTAGVCRDAGLEPGIQSRPDDRIPGSQMGRLWKVAIDRTGDPFVAVHMAEAFHPAALDILGYVVLTCRTIAEVLDCLARYAGLLNDGLRVQIEHSGARSTVRLALISSHTDNYLPEHSQQVAESMWIGLARQLRLLTGEPINPLEVWFRHHVRDDSEYRRLLNAPLRFGAPEDRFVLSRSDLARQLPSANPVLFSVFEQHAARLLAGLAGRHTAVGRVSRIVAEKLRGRVPPIGEVASEMAMSARHLQRALSAEGRTYQEVLDEVRCAMARRYLAEPVNSVSQVAFMLGFSEAAAFHRAFKRWTGKTPAAARRLTSPESGRVLEG